jgi:hypothetical protein
MYNPNEFWKYEFLIIVEIGLFFLAKIIGQITFVSNDMNFWR